MPTGPPASASAPVALPESPARPTAPARWVRSALARWTSRNCCCRSVFCRSASRLACLSAASCCRLLASSSRFALAAKRSAARLFRSSSRSAALAALSSSLATFSASRASLSASFCAAFSVFSTSLSKSRSALASAGACPAMFTRMSSLACVADTHFPASKIPSSPLVSSCRTRWTDSSTSQISPACRSASSSSGCRRTARHCR